jgi:hypothetical protein
MPSSAIVVTCTGESHGSWAHIALWYEPVSARSRRRTNQPQAETFPKHTDGNISDALTGSEGLPLIEVEVVTLHCIPPANLSLVIMSGVATVVIFARN